MRSFGGVFLLCASCLFDRTEEGLQGVRKKHNVKEVVVEEFSVPS